MTVSEQQHPSPVVINLPQRPRPNPPTRSPDGRMRWAPGTSGNPAGSPPRTLQLRQIKDITQDGATILKFLASVMDGKVKGARVTDRVAAARELADRLWGKPVAAVEITGKDGQPIRTESIMANVDTATLRQLVALRDQMLALAMVAQVPELVEADDEKLPPTAPADNDIRIEEA